jgi:GNAT superfamily N-acetyltransferase
VPDVDRERSDDRSTNERRSESVPPRPGSLSVVPSPGAAKRAGQSSGEGVDLRLLRAGEGARLRELRLRSLRDAPLAFASSFEIEAARPESYWTDLADSCAMASHRAVFVATDGRRWLAMAGSHWFDQSAGIAQLWGMWVEPPARGIGLGRRLVDRAASWAAGRGADVLRLGVTDRASEIAAFYEHLSFKRTGETKLLPPDGAVTAFFLAKSICKPARASRAFRDGPLPSTGP